MPRKLQPRRGSKTKTMNLQLIALSILCFSLAVKAENVPCADFWCQNGGVCKLSLMPLRSEEISSCQCPPGFLGNSCEIFATPCGNRFCFNGGVCRSENDECRCPHDWTGVWCEVMKISDTATANHHANAPPVLPKLVPATTHAPPPQSPSTLSTNSYRTSQTRKAELFHTKIFLVFALLATLAFVCGISGCCTRRKGSKSISSMGLSCGMLYGGSEYHGDFSSEKNTAPKMDDDDEFFGKIILPVAPASDCSPRSARAVNAEKRTFTFEHSPRALNRVTPKSLPHITNDDAAPSPQLFMGPPRDEDGNELYNVEIL